MIKTLTKHGNSAALVIERPILDLLGVSLDAAFEIVTDGKALILTPVKNASRSKRFHQSMEKTGKRYAKAFEELAK